MRVCIRSRCSESTALGGGGGGGYLILYVTGQSSMVRMVRMIGSIRAKRFFCMKAEPIPLSVTWSIGQPELKSTKSCKEKEQRETQTLR